MAEKYVAFIPEDWEFSLDAEARLRIAQALVEHGIVQGNPQDPSALRNGADYQKLFADTDPKPSLDGEGMGCDPGKMTVEIHGGALRGFAGDNLTPLACNHCSAELPYEGALDAFGALTEGEGADSTRLQLECYHCGEFSSAIGADYGRSAAFACSAVIFTGETSNRVEPAESGLKLLTEIVGTPMTWVQIHGW